jgi:hypothetical protein
VPAALRFLVDWALGPSPQVVACHPWHAPFGLASQRVFASWLRLLVDWALGLFPQVLVDWALGLFLQVLVDWALGLFPQVLVDWALGLFSQVVLLLRRFAALQRRPRLSGGQTPSP